MTTADVQVTQVAQVAQVDADGDAAARHGQLVAQAQALVRKRDALDRELAELAQVLASHRIGMTEPLVDKDGFPRSDVDVYAVRHARSSIIRKRNDYMALTADIERALHHMHAAARLLPPSAASASSESASSESASAEPARPRKPFARVNGVAPDSPSSDASLVRDDLILQFGSVAVVDAAATSTSALLTAVTELVQRSENHPLELVVQRNGAETRLQVTPRRWGGRGLLGCHLVPVL
ncbi:hypothetical protein BC831DRAFT_450181 [Entophlyctis helioformis]|nr:hypothetical protein BC831DRAFT_450181 [Entophlyctis helioformis]